MAEKRVAMRETGVAQDDPEDSNSPETIESRIKI